MDKISQAPSPELTQQITKQEGSSFELTTNDGKTASPLPQEQRLHRGLKARHIAMIAIGGAIGNGLIIGTGLALAEAGPAPLLISYTIIGFLVFVVMTALGEMATWLPLGSGFTGYAARFVDPALGFSLGWTYWIKYALTMPNQLTAASLVLQYWVDRDRVNPGVFIAVFLVVVVAINFFGSAFFGEVEFWMTCVKVIVIVGLMILCIVLALGGGPNHDRTGFRYWSDPGAFNEVILTGASGRFLAVWSTLITATLAYLGTEMVGVTVGEAQNPRRTVPRAMKLTFYRILFFYVGSVLFLGMVVPYNSEQLAFATKQSTSASASPFVVAIQLASINVLPGIVNACILIFLFSAANTDLYVSSRTLYSLAIEGSAPQIFKYTNSNRIPVYALIMSASFGLLAFMNISDDSKRIFKYLISIITTFGLLTWISILVSHIYFVRARRARDVPDTALVYKAPLGIYGSYGSLLVLSLVLLTKNFTVFVSSSRAGGSYGKFDYKTFITGYVGIPIYLILILGYKVLMRSKTVRPENADLFGGRREINDEEAEFLEARNAEMASRNRERWGVAYRFIAWLF